MSVDICPHFCMFTSISSIIISLRLNWCFESGSGANVSASSSSTTQSGSLWAYLMLSFISSKLHWSCSEFGLPKRSPLNLYCSFRRLPMSFSLFLLFLVSLLASGFATSLIGLFVDVLRLPSQNHLPISTSRLAFQGLSWCCLFLIDACLGQLPWVCCFPHCTPNLPRCTS